MLPEPIKELILDMAYVYFRPESPWEDALFFFRENAVGILVAIILSAILVVLKNRHEN